MRLSKLFSVLILLCLALPAHADSSTFYFSVLNQRSPTLTAQYWNPILAYISKKTQLDLKLKIARTAVETTALTVRGEAQFAFTNHLFTPDRAGLGWRVIARPETEGIFGQIVVNDDSPVQRVEELQGLTVAFPSAEAFVGYKVIMDGLLRKGIQVTPIFSGNQEGAIGLLKSQKALAAGVNKDVMAAFAKRESFKYRVMWTSERFHDLAVMANPNFVSERDIRAVQKALVEMQRDPEGAEILRQGADLLKLSQARGFVVATDHDYENYLAFHRNTVLKDK